jgi:small subunit ribosomal protein S21
MLSKKVKSDIILIAKKGGILMTKVVVRNGNVESALRTFKQKNIKDGLLKEVKKRESYIKPGEKRRNAKKEAIKNSRRKERSYNRAA